jgi:hypothetical protein
MRAKAAWTLMFYMNGDGNQLSVAARDALGRLGRIGSSFEVHLVAQVDLGDNVSNGSGSWANALRFHISPDMPPRAEYALPGYHADVNMGSGKVLAEFVYWATREFPADRYALILWGHGQGFAMQRLALEASRTPNDPLFLKEIREELAGVLPRKLDFIGFDACCMATVETAYEVRDLAEVMVAGEEVEEGSGWVYDWIAKLKESVSISGRELGGIVIEDERRKNVTESCPKVRTLSLLDLSAVGNLAAAIDEFVETVRKGGAAGLESVNRARGLCLPFSSSGAISTVYANTIDLQSFMGSLKADRMTSAAIGVATLQVCVAADRVVIRKFALPGVASPPLGAQGISIYFPADRDRFDADGLGDWYMGTNGQSASVQFSEDHQWVRLLRDLYGIPDPAAATPRAFSQDRNKGELTMSKLPLDGILEERQMLQQQVEASSARFAAQPTLAEDKYIPEFCRSWALTRVELEKAQAETDDPVFKEHIAALIIRNNRLCVGLRLTPDNERSPAVRSQSGSRRR